MVGNLYEDQKQKETEEKRKNTLIDRLDNGPLGIHMSPLSGEEEGVVPSGTLVHSNEAGEVLNQRD